MSPVTPHANTAKKTQNGKKRKGTHVRQAPPKKEHDDHDPIVMPHAQRARTGRSADRRAVGGDEKKKHPSMHTGHVHLRASRET